MSEPDYPTRLFTAREALFEIRRLHATIDPAKLVSTVAFDEVAQEGLSLPGIENFELSDRLADRLAEAHELLRKYQFAPIEVDGLAGALALPPDLEAMVERRMAEELEKAEAARVAVKGEGEDKDAIEVMTKALAKTRARELEDVPEAVKQGYRDQARAALEAYGELERERADGDREVGAS